ncbi:MAG: urease subunit gamma [Actinomycetes bacterium]
MQLTPSERDRLLLFTTAELARRRQARGLRLNVPEATALVADTAAEAARDGMRLADAIAAGRSVLTVDDVLPGVPAIVGSVCVEALFDDGTRLIVIPDPFQAGAIENLPDQPGAILVAQGLSNGPDPSPSVRINVTNTAQVPISVTSHFHFFEVNPRLHFDRAAAYGHHLAIPAGSAVRFDPDTQTAVELTPIGGERVVIGFSGLVDGALDAAGAKQEALRKARATGFLGAGEGA